MKKDEVIRMPEELRAVWEEKIRPSEKKKILRYFKTLNLTLEGLATTLICDFFPPNCVLMRELAKIKVLVLSLERLLDESIPVRDVCEIRKQVEDGFWKQHMCFNSFIYEEITGKKLVTDVMRRTTENEEK